MRILTTRAKTRVEVNNEFTVLVWRKTKYNLNFMKWSLQKTHLPCSHCYGKPQLGPPHTLNNHITYTDGTFIYSLA